MVSFDVILQNFKLNHMTPSPLVTKMCHEMYGFLPRAVRGLRERGRVNFPNSNGMTPGMMMTLASYHCSHKFGGLYVWCNFGCHVATVLVGNVFLRQSLQQQISNDVICATKNPRTTSTFGASRQPLQATIWLMLRFPSNTFLGWQRIKLCQVGPDEAHHGFHHVFFQHENDWCLRNLTRLCGGLVRFVFKYCNFKGSCRQSGTCL